LRLCPPDLRRPTSNLLFTKWLAVVHNKTGTRLGRAPRLLDMAIVAVCASTCGADHWTEVEAFGKAKLAWLSTFPALPGGIHSRDMFGRLFCHLDPEALDTSFREWTAGLRQRV